MPRSLVVSREVREDWFRRLEFEISEAKSARSEYLGYMRQSYNQYRNILPVKNRPWPGCANLSPPMTTRACEQVIRRIVMHFLQNREYIHLAANSMAVSSLDRTKKVEAYLRWQAENELEYFDAIDAFTRHTVIGGTGICETGWISEERYVADVLVLGRERLMPAAKPGGDPVYKATGEQATRKDSLDEILNEIFGGNGFEPTSRRKKGVEDKGAIEIWEVAFKDKGEEKVATVTIDRSEDLGDEIEVMAEIPKLVKDRPFIRPLNVENVIVPPGDHTIYEAPFVATREFVNVDYIEDRLDSGEWRVDKEERDEIMDSLLDEEGWPKTQASKAYEDEDHQRRDDDAFVGVDSDFPRARKVPVMKIVTHWDIREKGEYVDAEIIMLPRQRKIVRIQYDSVNNRAGMRNFVHRNYLPVRDEFYGLSLPQLMKSLQTEMNTIHNQRVDREAITGNPILFVDPSAHFERDNALYSPGEMIPVPEPRNNVFTPMFSNSQIDDLRLEQQLMSWGQDLSAIGSQAVGASESRPNAQRTARGAQLLLGQMQQSIEYQAESIRPAVVNLWKQIYSWDAAHIRPGKEFRIMGSNEVAAFETREEFRGDFDFIFDVDSSIMNSEIERFLWTEWFQLVAPIANARADQVTKEIVDLCSELGKRRKIPNPERFLPKVLDHQGEPVPPEVEHQIFMMGRPVQTHPQDEIMVHLEAHAQFAEQLMSRESDLTLPPSGLQYFFQHLQETMRQADSMGKGLPAGMNGQQQFQLEDNRLIQGGPGQPPGAQPEAVTGPQLPNQGPGVEGAGIG